MFTLEAAVVLPLAACFFVSILFLFRVMQVQIEVQKALDNTGRQIAVYFDETAGPGNVAVEALFIKELSERRLVKAYVRGGAAGISLAGSELDGREVNLEAVYHIRFPLRLLGLLDVKMVQRADCRKWTGWEPEQGEGDSDTWVYIAETGRVYHLTDSCTHLKLSVQQVEIGSVSEMRNESGAKYKECRFCEEENSGQKQVYITKQGDCYHYNLNCSGIKRTVFKIRRSETKELRVCSKCGG